MNSLQQSHCSRSGTVIQCRRLSVTGQYTHQLDMFGNIGPLDPDWPTVMKALQDVGYETASIGKTHYHGMPTRERVQASREPSDMREYEPFVAQFGWDYVLEEYDRYVHTSRRIRTPYTDHLERHGLAQDYRDMIKSVFRLTPEHWRAKTSVLPQELDLSSFLVECSVDLDSGTPCELFDLTDDPGELCNLVNHSAHTSLIDGLRTTVLAEHLAS